jgi:hypothetical protein
LSLSITRFYYSIIWIPKKKQTKMIHKETNWARTARDAKISTCWANWTRVVGGFILSTFIEGSIAL